MFEASRFSGLCELQNRIQMGLKVCSDAYTSMFVPVIL